LLSLTGGRKSCNFKGLWRRKAAEVVGVVTHFGPVFTLLVCLGELINIYFFNSPLLVKMLLFPWENLKGATATANEIRRFMPFQACLWTIFHLLGWCAYDKTTLRSHPTTVLAHHVCITRPFQPILSTPIVAKKCSFPWENTKGATAAPFRYFTPPHVTLSSFLPA
jgi:hypothetical protein